MPDARPRGQDSQPGKPGRVPIVIGSLLYLLVGWPYLGSGLLVPFPWVIGMWLIWLVGLFVLVRVVKRAPTWTPVVPVAALAVWAAVIALGDILLGWTA